MMAVAQEFTGREGSLIAFLTSQGPVDLELVEVQVREHYLSLLFRAEHDAGIVSESCTMLHGDDDLPVVLLTRVRPRRLNQPGVYYQTVIS